jgi:hypothetical protein
LPYAVTCKSCGARFSVADELVHKKLSGKVVVLRCKRCHEPIRINASEPPGRGSSRPPSPAARSPLPQGPARPKPRPPLKARPTGTVMGLGPRKPPPRNIRREQEEDAKGGVNHDLFDASPPLPDGELVDLSDMAHSEPPGSASLAPDASNAKSSAPPLFALAHAEKLTLPRSEDDVDFLLGLTGSPGTAATLASPSLSDLARKAPSEPPPSAPKPRAVAVARATPREAAAETGTKSSPSAPAAQPDKAKKRSSLGLVLGFAAIGAAALGFSLTQKHPEPSTAEPPLALPVAASEPEPKSAQPEPSAAPVAAPTEATSAVSSAEPAPRAAYGASTAQTGHAAGPGANGSAKAVRAEAAAPAAATTAAAATPAPKAVIAPKPEPAAAGTPFDRAAAASALASAAAQASACRKDGDPSGVASVTLTFAPSGRVTTAKLSGPPFAGTATGGCIASTLRRAKIPPYDGDLVTVAKTIVVQ